MTTYIYIYIYIYIYTYIYIYIYIYIYNPKDCKDSQFALPVLTNPPMAAWQHALDIHLDITGTN